MFIHPTHMNWLVFFYENTAVVCVHILATHEMANFSEFFRKFGCHVCSYIGHTRNEVDPPAVGMNRHDFFCRVWSYMILSCHVWSYIEHTWYRWRFWKFVKNTCLMCVHIKITHDTADFFENFLKIKVSCVFIHWIYMKTYEKIFPTFFMCVHTLDKHENLWKKTCPVMCDHTLNTHDTADGFGNLWKILVSCLFI